MKIKLGNTDLLPGWFVPFLLVCFHVLCSGMLIATFASLSGRRETSYLHIYQGMYWPNFFFSTKLMCDL